MSGPDEPRASSRLPVRAGDPLTPRERELLALIAAGKRTRNIADQLGISPNTVKSHLSRAYRKLGARNRVEAARHYLHGAAAPPPAGARTSLPRSGDREPSRLIERQIQELEARLDEISAAVAEADRLRQAIAALRAIQHDDLSSSAG